MQKCPPCAKDVMVTNLVTLSPDMDVFDAISLLLRHRISGAPVIDSAGNYLGVFSERCSMSVLLKAAYEQLPTSDVQAFMDADAPTIEEETDLLTIAHDFFYTQSRRFPVLRDGKVVGQVSRRDVLRAVHQMTEVAPTREAALLYLSSLVERDEAPIS